MKLKQFFDPPAFVKWLAAAGSVILLRYSLTNLPAEHPVSIFSYGLSAYTLAVLVRFLIRSAANMLTDYQPKTFIGRIIWSASSRSLAAMCISVIYSMTFAVIYLISGIRDNLLWDISVGIYYFILTLILSYLLYHRFKKDLDHAQQIKVFRLCAVMLLVLDAALALRAYQITWMDITMPKDQIFVIAVSVWTFFNVITCIIQSARNHKIRSYLLSSVIAVKFATSMVSLFNLQSSMLVSFGDDAEFAHRMNLVTGNAVFLLILFECVIMLIKTQESSR